MVWPFPDRISHLNRFFDDLRLGSAVEIQPVDDVPEKNDQRVPCEIRIPDSSWPTAD